MDCYEKSIFVQAQLFSDSTPYKSAARYEQLSLLIDQEKCKIGNSRLLSEYQLVRQAQKSYPSHFGKLSAILLQLITLYWRVLIYPILQYITNGKLKKQNSNCINWVCLRVFHNALLWNFQGNLVTTRSNLLLFSHYKILTKYRWEVQSEIALWDPC